MSSNSEGAFGFAPNIDVKERITSVASGAILVHEIVSNRDKSVVKALTAGYMLFRGTTGYCPLSRARFLMP
ncbi:MAG: hypothetical protein WD059_03075 [Balneolaceae bacterium]